MKVTRELRWIPPAPSGDKLTRSQYGSPLNEQEGSELRWVPPALSSQRHRIHSFDVSYPSSEKTFPRDEEPGDLTSRERFLLSRRLNESKGIVASRGRSPSILPAPTRPRPAATTVGVHPAAPIVRVHPDHQSGASSNSSSPYMKGCQTIEELIQLARTSQGGLSPTQLAAFWSRMPRLLTMIHSQDHCNVSKQEHQQLKNDLQSILAETVKKVDKFGSTALTGTALGMAKIVSHYRDRSNVGRSRQYQSLFQELLFDRSFKAQEELFQLLASYAVPLLPRCNARSLSSLAYTYALIRFVPVMHDGTTLLDRISRYATENLESFEPQGISNTVWAYATLGATRSHLFEEFADFASQRTFDNFNPQDLANIVWAYSEGEKPIASLFNKVAVAVVARDMKSFSPRYLSNIVLAYARSAQSSPCLFDKVAQDIIARDLRFFNEQDLSNTLWAYAKAGHSNPALFKKFADAIIARDLNSSFKCLSFSNILWAYAKVGVYNRALFTKIANAIIEHDMSAFDGQSLSIIAWAFATANIYHPRLFDVISDAAISLKREFNPQQTTMLLWAYASIGRVSQSLFASFVPTVSALMQDFDCQGLANIAWSYSVSNVTAPCLFDCGFIATLLDKEHDFIDAELRQLHQWQLWQLELGSATNLPFSLQQRCYEAFILDRIQSSFLQDDVVDVLTSICLKPQEEVLMPSGYRLDAKVMVNGVNVGVEVDGPSHFTGYLPNGHTILKRRQVSKVDGLVIVSVPYWEWEALENTRPKRQEYLSHKLGVNTPPGCGG